ncbi:MAG: hypothetical protein MJZ51_07240 [Bacteroidales bacterium]|nr:hypothetical protein [Bacteroidales bacterium]
MPNIKKIAGILLAALYLSYFAGTHLFYHSHIVQHTTVTHSHPYSKHHSHSLTQLQLIDELCSYSLTDDLGWEEMPAATCQYWEYPIHAIGQAALQAPQSASLRAPPAVEA